MENKICSKCKNNKSVDCFYKAKKHKDGLQSYCKSCILENSKRDYQQNGRKEVFAKRASRERTRGKIFTDNIRRTIGCRLCPEKEPCCIDFHHLKDKDNLISSLRQRKNKTLLVEEILKCEVLCANCHRKVHIGLLQSSGITVSLEEMILCGLNEYCPDFLSRCGVTGSRS